MTPFSWDNPNIYGAITVTVSKPGYTESSRSIEFTGGSQSEFFTLEEASPSYAAAPPAAPSYTAPAASVPTSFAEEEQETAPPPPPLAPVRTYTPPPAPAPVAEEPAGEGAKVFISSIPPVSDVYLDGKLIGKTNITKLNVYSGTHTLRLVKGTKEITKTMTFKAGDNPAVHIQF
jgi:hypothetical protein